MADSDDSKDISKADGGAKAPAKKPARVNSKNMAVLGNYIINCGASLDAYGNGPVKSFEAGLKRSGGSGMIALVCERFYTPRFKDVENYESVINPHCMRLRKRGVVYWPPAEEERYVFIYDGSIGKPLLDSKFSNPLALKQDAVIELVARPLIFVLLDLHNKGLVHGSIRGDNVFDGGTQDMKSIVLGDFLSVPASSTQPVVYETIERGMVDPIARGLGTIEDDLYAFGVLLASLMQSSNPLKGMSDDQIIQHKIEFGSYATVTGKDRFTGSILELLRGVLHDDETQRWTIEEVSLWMDGRRLSPKQTTRDKKALRPFKFNDEMYYLLPVLAMNLDKNQKEVSDGIKDGRMLRWVERSVEDMEAFARLEQVSSDLQGKGQGDDYMDQATCFVSMALDPTGPIRYCGINARAGGIGAALSEAVGLQKDVKPYVDLFLKDIIFKWLTAYEGGNLDLLSLNQKYDSCKRALRQGTMGYGIERCIYILNERAICYSDKLREYYISKPEELLDAVEKKCTKNELEGLILDRHMVAFLSMNESRVVDQFLFDLNSTDYHQNILGNIKCFAAMQERFSVSSLPGIARVLHNMLPAVLKRYHDKATRDNIRQKAKRFMKSGDLVKMSALLENASAGKKDHAAFLAAMKEYSTLKQSYDELKDGMQNNKDFGKSTGQDVAALFASIISLLIVLLTGYSYL